MVLIDPAAAVPGLPGRPDLVFPTHLVVIFCDGDFWHGRNLEDRLTKLGRGHNSVYWVEKVRRNVDRDRAQTRMLQQAGWTVLRFWETDVLRWTQEIADDVVAALAEACRPSATRRSRELTGHRDNIAASRPPR